MTNRERALAILDYQNFDRLPAVHFGYWSETLQKWHMEGHITEEEAALWGDGNKYDQSIAEKLGFDFNWLTCFGAHTGLLPAFEEKVIEVMPDGFKKVFNADGVIVLKKDSIESIPAEVSHLLTDRESYEEHYKFRLQYDERRIDFTYLDTLNKNRPDAPLILHCGSLFGNIRNLAGVEGISYIYADDEDLFTEIIDTNAELCYRLAEKILSTGVKFDLGHFWEDICFKNGPLVIPSVFYEKVGPHYKRMAELFKKHDINLMCVDCDGYIDSLIPTWFENGINIMFPIEIGTWNASIEPWRKKYGKELRGVGGMNKTIFGGSKSDIDKEIERLKPLVALGGFIPCPDHRIPPDAKWENVQYYAEQIKKCC